MKTSIRHSAATLFAGLILTAAMPAFAVHIDTPQETGTTASPFVLDPFVLDEHGYERVEFVTGKFAQVEAFSVVRAGTYTLTLTDMLFPGALRKLGVAVTTAENKLADIFGTGSALLDLQPGLYYLSIYAKPCKFDPGLFGLSLHLRTETAVVPVPAAAWLFGSGLIGLAGLGRQGKRVPQ